MSRIHFVGGEKGGVGKSVLARLLCQWMLERSVPFVGIDADLSQASLRRGYRRWCAQIDLTQFGSADQIMDRALASEREVVVDLAAQSFSQLLSWMRESDLVSLARETGVQLIFWQVTDGSFQSVCHLEEAMAELDPYVSVVLVENHRWSDDFTHLELSAPIRELKRRGCVVRLASLDSRLMYKLDERGGCLTVSVDDDGAALAPLSAMEGRRLSQWLLQAFAELEAIPLSHAEAEKDLVEQAADDTELESHDSELEPAAPAAGQERKDPPGHAHKTPSVALPPVGTTWVSGPRTWTEVGQDCLIHHVRFR